MAVSASGIQARIVAAMLLSLREEVTLPRVVNTDYSSDAAKQGDTVFMGTPTALATYDVTPAATPPALQTTTIANRSIALSRWKAVRFDVTTKNLMELADPANVKNSEMGEQIRALAAEINAFIFSLYTQIPWHVGTAGTTPYATTVDGTVDSRTRLNRGLAPDQGRVMTLDYASEGNALKLAAFSDAAKTGSPDELLNGELATKYGLRHIRDGQVPLHTAGTASAGTITVGTGGFVVPAGVGLQDVTIPLTAASGTPTLVVGDTGNVTVNGTRYEFVVKTAISLSTGVTSVSCSMCGNVIAVTVVATTAVTINASHRVNLAFHRNAFALAVRPTLILPSEAGRAVIVSDPVSKLAFKLLNLGGYHAEQYEMSVLYGADMMRPEHACRNMG